MPGLRFFICDRCETVYAEVDPPDWCWRCDAEGLSELDVGGQAAYFWPTENRC